MSHLQQMESSIFSLKLDLGKSLIFILLVYFILDITSVLKWIKEKIRKKDDGIVFEKRDIEYNPNNLK